MPLDAILIIYSGIPQVVCPVGLRPLKFPRIVDKVPRCAASPLQVFGDPLHISVINARGSARCDYSVGGWMPSGLTPLLPATAVHILVRPLPLTRVHQHTAQLNDNIAQNQPCAFFYLEAVKQALLGHRAVNFLHTVLHGKRVFEALPV